MKSRIKTFVSKKRWLIIGLVVMLVVVGLIWRSRQPKEVELVFASPTRGNITKTLEVSGFVDAKQKARLKFLAGGKLTYLGAKEGDAVRKGQVIAGIDKATLQKQLQQNLNEYMQERWNWEQRLDDTADRWLPEREQRQKDQAQWTLDNEVLTVEIKDIAIKDSNLVSPLTGILTTAPSTITGIQLTAADYFEVVDPQTLVFRAPVDEVDIKDVSIGQTALVTLDAYPDEPIQTTISYIAPISSKTESGTAFVVELALPEATDLTKLRLGMNGDVSITLDSKNDVLSVPLSATRTRDGQTFLDVKTGEKTYAEREIQVGLETDEQVEVTAGLNQDEQILIPTQ